MLVPYYQVKNIRFDFTLDDENDVPTVEEQTNISDAYVNTYWYGEDEDDVMDKISNDSGWCISAIDLELAEVEIFDNPFDPKNLELA